MSQTDLAIMVGLGLIYLLVELNLAARRYEMSLPDEERAELRRKVGEDAGVW